MNFKTKVSFPYLLELPLVGLALNQEDTSISQPKELNLQTPRVRMGT